MTHQIIYLYRPKKRDVCVALAETFWQMRPSSLTTHGFGGCKTIAYRNATDVEVEEFNACPRVSWWKYSHWDGLIKDEAKLAGEAWALYLKGIVQELVPEHNPADTQHHKH